MSRHQRGETLLGLLVGLAIGLSVLTAAANMLAQLFRAQRLALQESHAQQDLQWALELIARELANAQYVANAWRSRNATNCQDPFCNGPEDFNVASNRLDFSLDRNHNGAQDNNECTGLRLNAGALQVRTACIPETWTPLTDTSMLRVTRLDVQLLCQRRNAWVQRSVRLRAEAQTPAPSERTLVAQRQVRLRNTLSQTTSTASCP